MRCRLQIIDVLEAQIKSRPAMKKGSSRAAAQSRNISRQQLTIGLDLGDRNSWLCVVDEAGQIQLEQRVRTNAKALREVFGTMPRGSGSHWKSGRIRQDPRAKTKRPKLNLSRGTFVDQPSPKCCSRTI